MTKHGKKSKSSSNDSKCIMFLDCRPLASYEPCYKNKRTYKFTHKRIIIKGNIIATNLPGHCPFNHIQKFGWLENKKKNHAIFPPFTIFHVLINKYVN